MANTTADKLALLEDTKAAMKSAINGSGSTVGDVFSEYPAAITSGKAAIARATTNKGVATAATDTFAQMAANIEQIETGGGTATLTLNQMRGVECTFINSDGEVVQSKNGSSLGEHTIPVPSIIFVVSIGNAFTSGDISLLSMYSNMGSGEYYMLYLVDGNASITY